MTLSDLDMQNRKISVNHQLQRKRNMEYVIEDTKTSCGTREIPMTDEVYECFQRIISSRKKPRVEPYFDTIENLWDYSKSTVSEYRTGEIEFLRKQCF